MRATQACAATLERGTSHINATANAFADKCPGADWPQGQPESDGRWGAAPPRPNDTDRRRARQTRNVAQPAKRAHADIGNPTSTRATTENRNTSF